MDLKLFLDPVDPKLYDEGLPNTSFQKSIFINREIMYDLDGIEIALLGVTEHRDASMDEGFSKGPAEIRKKLYGLTSTSGKNRILDLGNLRNGPTAEETKSRLREVVGHLLEKGVVPVIMGGTHDMDIGQFRGYEALERLITCLNVDARFDLEGSSEDASQMHVGKILKHDPNFLFNYIHLAYQTYFVSDFQRSVMEKLYFEAIRVGEIHENLEELEPVIRDAEMVTFDVSAIRSAYCPGVRMPNVFGLTGEEACQICWYAGLNDKLSSIGFYEYNPDLDDPDRKSASVIATMIWYFIDGFYNRKGDKSFLSNDYLVYEVAIGENPASIRFYKSKLSEKWWMEIPDDESDSVFLRSKMIPCSYADYEKAGKGEIPERWLNTVNKIN